MVEFSPSKCKAIYSISSETGGKRREEEAGREGKEGRMEGGLMGDTY